jgi:hypothetical protein
VPPLGLSKMSDDDFFGIQKMSGEILLYPLDWERVVLSSLTTMRWRFLAQQISHGELSSPKVSSQRSKEVRSTYPIAEGHLQQSGRSIPASSILFMFDFFD